VYRGSDGVDRYVKFYDDPAQAAGEHLANKIYAELGLGSLESTTFEHEGKLAYASKMLPKAEQIGKKLTPDLAKKALDGFAADVLLANWDAAGLGLDNMVVIPGKKVVRIDNGAALLSRARGSRKSEYARENPSEWKSFFDPKVNPAYAKLAASAGVTRPEDMAEQVLKSIKKIEKLAKKSGGWEAFVNEHAPGLSAADRVQIVDMLDARTAFLKSKIPELKAAADAGKVAKPAVSSAPIRDEEIRKAKEAYSEKRRAAATFLAQKDGSVVKSYTGSAYRMMNRTLYDGPEQLVQKGYSLESIKDYQEQNKRLQAALLEAKASGHAIDGVVYRGVHTWPGLMQELESGEIVFKGFTSTTIKPTVTSGFGGSGTLFRIRQRSAIPVEDITVNQDELEAIMPAGSRFRVLHKKQEGQKTIVDLEEIE
jgi:hypothetical protein